MIVAVSVNHSVPYDFLLDTGTQFSMVDPALATELHLKAEGSIPVAGTGFESDHSTGAQRFSTFITRCTSTRIGSTIGENRFRVESSIEMSAYCSRNACIGSTEAARKAGRAEAAIARTKTAIAVNAITSGSKGLT